ncbi:hypothetical protein Goshw_001421, partial [Gossypium schwendimanii]|nr:hypothetical protein [Gossypium schwendimanii]
MQRLLSLKQASSSAFSSSCSSLLHSLPVRFFRPQIPKSIFGFGPNRGLLKSRWRLWFQRFSASDMVLGLVLTNVAVFLLWRIADRRFMMDNFMVSLDNFKSGRLHTLITSAFSHIDIEHIVSNMIGLYFFGYNIGRIFGPEYLLRLYLAGAMGGSVFYLVHHAFLAK